MLQRVIYWLFSVVSCYSLIVLISQPDIIAIRKKPLENDVMPLDDIPAQVDVNNPKARTLVVDDDMALAAYKETIHRQRGKLKENFVMIPNADVPHNLGNFQCDSSEFRGSCAFYVENYEEALQQCELEQLEHCKAFVLNKHMIVYLKKNVPHLIHSKDSSVFVTKHILKSLSKEKMFADAKELETDLV